MNPKTKNALHNLTSKSNELFNHPSVPDWAKQGYIKLRDTIQYYGDLEKRSKAE